jgi:hypothetical protein
MTDNRNMAVILFSYPFAGMDELSLRLDLCLLPPWLRDDVAQVK